MKCPETKQAKTIKKIYCSQLLVEFSQNELFFRGKKIPSITQEFPDKLSEQPSFSFVCLFVLGGLFFLLLFLMQFYF